MSSKWAWRQDQEPARKTGTLCQPPHDPSHHIQPSSTKNP